MLPFFYLTQWCRSIYSSFFKDWLLLLILPKPLLLLILSKTLRTIKATWGSPIRNMKPSIILFFSCNWMHFTYNWRSRESIAFCPLVLQSFFLVAFNAVDRLDQSVGDLTKSGRVNIVVTKCLSFNRESNAAQVGTIAAWLNDFNTLQTVSSAEWSLSWSVEHNET